MAICKPTGKVSEGINPANTLLLDFQLPELFANKFLLFKPPGFGMCYGGPKQMNTS